MGREIKRVPLDFDWPLNAVWKGYLNPFRSEPCPWCEGSGYTPEAKRISDAWYGLDDRLERWSDNITQDEVQALIDADRLWHFTHTWSREHGWQRREDGYVPTAAEVNEWSRHGIGHDSINHHV